MFIIRLIISTEKLEGVDTFIKKTGKELTILYAFDTNSAFPGKVLFIKIES